MLQDTVRKDKYDIINVFAAEEHGITYEWTNTKDFKLIESFAEKKQLNIVFGCVDDGLFYSRGDLCKYASYYFWPTFWISNTVHNNSRIKLSSERTRFDYAYSCLNRNAHHRCMLIDELSRRGLLDKGAVSWHDPAFDYKWKHWSPKRLTLDAGVDLNNLTLFCPPQEFYTSFCNIVSESTTEVNFITEKTVMPILAKIPFIVYAAPGFSAYLESLGFVLYTEIFDYSFDDIFDDNARANAIAVNIRNISKLDFAKTYYKLRPKIEHNYHQALKIAKDKTKIPDIIFEYISRTPKTSEYSWLQDFLRLT